MDHILHGLAVKLRRVDGLKPHPNNSRVHPKFQLNRIAASLKQFGFVKPILTAGDTVIAGHGVLQAAKQIGLSEVPTIEVGHLSPEQIRAYLLADNKLASLSKWNPEKLAVELDFLLSLEGGFDLTVTGFDIGEAEAILSGKLAPTDDVVDAPPSGPAVTQSGQLWKAGKHRILCADSLAPGIASRLLGGERAALAFVDPPFNLKVHGHVSGKGRRRHREFAMASGEMTRTQFLRFLTKALFFLAENSMSGAVFYVCIDWRHIEELIAAGRKASLDLLNIAVWAKPNAGMGAFLRSQHEFVAVFRNGGKHANHVQLGKYGRNRTNLWSYASPASAFQRDEEHDFLVEHPSPKPVQMIADALIDVSKRGDVVLDTFLGIGSTLVAAERTGRRCYGVEIDPKYVDIAVRRFQRLTGEVAVDGKSGKRFDDIAGERLGANHA